MSNAPKIWIAAGESSGDLYGAQLARDLKRLNPAVEIAGMGGVKMREAGVRLLLFPECAATGYPPRCIPSPSAVDFDKMDRIYEELGALAEKHRMYLVVGTILRDGSRFFNSALVFRPQKGRYANVTKFLDKATVDEDAFLVRVLPTSAISGVMVMSDGPEINMIDMSGNRPAKIVSDMIDDCAKGDLDRASLLNYLTGSRWMNDPRGGDDKSVAILALANTREDRGALK